MWKTGAAFKDLHSIRFWGFNPSCSCATFVAIKTFRFFKGLAKWRMGLCAEMQLARQWLQMHFVMHVCWKNCYAGESFGSKKIANFAPCSGPQNGGWKMDPKMVPEFDPQNGVQKWHPKMGCKNCTQKRGSNVNKVLISSWSRYWAPFWVPFLDPIFGVPFLDSIFGGQILAPFLGSFFNPHFGVQNMVQNLHFFCCQSFHLHSNFFSNKHASQNASVVIA